MLPPFVALDFETADHGPDSACALGLVLIAGGQEVRARSWLLRPPREEFVFTYVHGITWDHVKDAPRFAEAWEEIASFLRQGSFFVAHNAAFDLRVLAACCEAAGVTMPSEPWLCSLEIARAAWPEPRHSLDKICAHLGIPLQHHDALSDARAAAALVLRAGALSEGYAALLGVQDEGPAEALRLAPSLEALRSVGEGLRAAPLDEPEKEALRAVYRARRSELEASESLPVEQAHQA